MISNIADQLKRDEGWKRSAYPDSLSFLTIGCGRMIDARKGGGLSDDEILLLLDNDLTGCSMSLDEHVPWWVNLDDARKGVLLNMTFQLGIDGLLEFKHFLQQMQVGNYSAASDEMLDSAWAKQTPERAQRLAAQCVDGVWR